MFNQHLQNLNFSSKLKIHTCCCQDNTSKEKRHETDDYTKYKDNRILTDGTIFHQMLVNLFTKGSCLVPCRIYLYHMIYDYQFIGGLSDVDSLTDTEENPWTIIIFVIMSTGTIIVLLNVM